MLETITYSRNRASFDAGADSFLVEDLGELGVGEGEGPETEVGGGVGDGAEDELDSLDELVDDGLGDEELVLDDGFLPVGCENGVVLVLCFGGGEGRVLVELRGVLALGGRALGLLFWLSALEVFSLLLLEEAVVGLVLLVVFLVKGLLVQGTGQQNQRHAYRCHNQQHYRHTLLCALLAEQGGANQLASLQHVVYHLRYNRRRKLLHARPVRQPL